jgi:hypothetical protein
MTRLTLVTAITLLIPSLAAADPRLRVEVGSAAEFQMEDDLPLMPSARVGAGVRLTERLELTASFRHTFFRDIEAPYKEPVAYDDVSLGLRIYQPVGGARLYLEPALLWSFWQEGMDAWTGDVSTPGVALRLGVEVPLDDTFSLGGGVGASLALGTEDFMIGFLSGDVHVSARF